MLEDPTPLCTLPTASVTHDDCSQTVGVRLKLEQRESPRESGILALILIRILILILVLILRRSICFFIISIILSNNTLNSLLWQYVVENAHVLFSEFVVGEIIVNPPMELLGSSIRFRITLSVGISISIHMELSYSGSIRIRGALVFGVALVFGEHSYSGVAADPAAQGRGASRQEPGYDPRG